MSVEISPNYIQYSRIFLPINFGQLPPFSVIHPDQSRISISPATRNMDELWQRRCAFLQPKWYQEHDTVSTIGKCCLEFGALLVAETIIYGVFRRKIGHLSLKVASYLAITALSTTLIGLYCLTKKAFPNDPTYVLEKGPQAEEFILKYSPSREYIHKRFPGLFTDEDINLLLTPTSTPRKVTIAWEERSKKLLQPNWYQQQDTVSILGTCCLVIAMGSLLGAATFAGIYYLAITALSTILIALSCLTKKVFPNDPTYMSIEGPKAEKEILRLSRSYRYIQKYFPDFFTQADLNFFIAMQISNNLQTRAYNTYYAEFIRSQGKEVLNVLNDENKKRLVLPFLKYLETRSLDIAALKSRFPEWQDLSVPEKDLKKAALIRELEKLFAEEITYQEFVDIYGTEIIKSLPDNIQEYIRQVFLQYVLKNSITVEQLQINFPEYSVLNIDIKYYKKLTVFNDFDRLRRREISYEKFKEIHGPLTLEVMHEKKRIA